MKNRLLFLALIVALLTSVISFGQNEPFGTASKYNIFVLNDMVHTGGDSEGAVAVGGNATVTSYGAGNHLPAGGNADGYGMVIGGNLDFSNGQSYHGDVHVGGTVTMSSATILDGVLVNPSSPIDFSAEETNLIALSNFWKNLPANGTYVLQTWGRLDLNGTSNDLNVFSVSAADWKGTKEVAFYVPAGSKVIVNVAGVSDNIPADHGNFGSIFLNGHNKTKIVWNFHEATQLHMQNMGWQGSVLAPKADFTYLNGNIEGNLVVKSCSMTAWSGEVHWYPLDGDFPKPGTTPSLQNVVPQLECVTRNTNGTFTAHFTYDNPNSTDVNIPVGAENYFAPSPVDRGQVTTFLSTNNAAFPNANFNVTWDGSTDLIWTVNGETVVASATTSPVCSEQVFFDKEWYDETGSLVNTVPANLPANYKIEVTSEFGTALGVYNAGSLNWTYNNTPGFADNNGLWVPINGSYVVHEFNLPADHSELAGTGSFVSEIPGGYATNPYNGGATYALHTVKNKKDATVDPTSAVINLGADSMLCQVNADSVTITGTLDLDPSPSNAVLHLTWQLLYPDSLSNDNSVNYAQVNVGDDTTFTITGYWPGITSIDTEVRLKFTAMAKSHGNALGAKQTKYVYWTPAVCPAPDPEEADLRLSKTVSDSTAENGDQVTYTIQLVNDGPKTAPNVVVSDLLPATLEYLTSSATQGVYDTSSGLWNVGNVPSGATHTLTITTKIDLDSLAVNVLNLGPASDYNVFVLKDINQPSSDTEGKMAVGRNAELSNYSVGDKLTTFGEDVLIVGGNLTYHSGRVYNGNVVYGNSTNLPLDVASVDGTISQGNPIDFNAASAYLVNLSTQLSVMQANGSVTENWSSLVLNGTDPFVNVFMVEGTNFTNATDISVNAPNGSVVVVNVKGNNIVWTGGLTVNGTDKSNVLYNFYQATKITISNIDVLGSVLAPKARVNFISGVQNGQMVAKFVEGTGQFNNTKFIGNIPADTSFTNIAEVFASGIADPDSDPNNGDASEDDYDFATVHVNHANGGNGSGGGSGSGGSAQWSNIGSFGSNEIVYVLTKDNNGDLLVGTWGGVIRRSTDDGNSWEQINENMNVGYIWSIVTDSTTGFIYTATEQGLYVSKDNGATWAMTALTGIDVRSAAVGANGELYAGTWGMGVYKSLDNGTTWVQVNTGLDFLVVNSLVVDGNGDIFAATFGGGVYKSVDDGANWVKLNVPYQHVWSLGVTSTNKLYAGTYGGGVYFSNNGGSSWSMANGGLPAVYVYAITVDGNDDVYISTWANGVFSTSSNGLNWQSFGFVRGNASAVYYNNESNVVYAGTGDGGVYALIDKPTAVEDETVVEVPEDFALGQNYPNPFNPSTTIKYSIKESGKYTIKVYNILGQEIATLLDGEVNAGTHTLNFTASHLASGIYFYHLSGDNVNITKKMVLLK